MQILPTLGLQVCKFLAAWGYLGSPGKLMSASFIVTVMVIALAIVIVVSGSM